MIRITSRELQLNLSKYLDKLPIIITKYNVDVAKLVKVEQEDEGKIKELSDIIWNQQQEIESLKNQRPQQQYSIPQTNKLGVGIDPSSFMTKKPQGTKICFRCKKYKDSTEDRQITEINDLNDEVEVTRALCNRCYSNYKREKS